VYEADLANGLGNLVSRLTTLAESAGLQGDGTAGSTDAPPDFHDALGEFRFDQALATLWAAVARINRELVEARPWEALRAGRVESARGDLVCWIRQLGSIAYWLSPFLPETANAIQDLLSQPAVRKAAPLFPRNRTEL